MALNNGIHVWSNARLCLEFWENERFVHNKENRTVRCNESCRRWLWKVRKQEGDKLQMCGNNHAETTQGELSTSAYVSELIPRLVVGSLLQVLD